MSLNELEEAFPQDITSNMTDFSKPFLLYDSLSTILEAEGQEQNKAVFNADPL